MDTVKDTRYRLEKCWENDFDWNLYPSYLKNGCFQIGKALGISPSAVLGGLVLVTSFALAPALVVIPGLDWQELNIVWLSINMPNGSGKHSLHKYLHTLIGRIRRERGCKADDPSWLLGNSTFREMEELMSKNDGRLFCLYDEMSTFLAQLNLYRGKGLGVSHELATLIQQYNGRPWTHRTVEGEFSMDETSLVVGGFSTPSVARALIEHPGNAEKSFSQCFLWLFPKPTYAKFESLEPVNEGFTKQVVSLLACKGGSPTTKRRFQVAYSSDAFRSKYDELQDQLHTLAARDDLLTGLLSKSKGQILRVAGCLQMLFHLQPNSGEEVLPGAAEMLQISESAIKAAINFVEVCVLHTALMAGRGFMSDETENLKTEPSEVEVNRRDIENAAAHTLRLPGQRLYLTPLLKAKKFRKFGYKEGALSAFRELENSDLGKIEEFGAEKGTYLQYVFIKAQVPAEADNAEFVKKLSKYGISLKEYKDCFEMPEISMSGKQRDDIPLGSTATTGRKRTLSSSSPCPLYLSPKRLAECNSNDSYES